MIEEWRDIKEFKGLYMVSNLGRVKALPRHRVLDDCIITPQLRCGRATVLLSRYGRLKEPSIKFLVYNAFNDDFVKTRRIHNIDGDVWNNRSDNLKAVIPKSIYVKRPSREMFSLIPKEYKIAIMEYFWNNHDNRDTVIAKIFGYKTFYVGLFIEDELNKHFNRIFAK